MHLRIKMINIAIDRIKNHMKTSSWILIAVFSLVALKSILVKPFERFSGFGGIFIIVLIYFTIFTISLLLYCYLPKTGWKEKETNASIFNIFLYMIPGLFISTVLWLANWPAIVQPDSSLIWHMIEQYKFNNLHPIIYIHFIRYMQRIWDNPGIIVAAQILYCSFVYGYTAYVFRLRGLKKKWCWFIAVILALLPVNAIYSVTFVKDVPYIMSLILITAAIFNFTYIKSNRFRHYIFTVIIMLFAGLVALFTRHNALLSIPLTVIVAAIVCISRKHYRKLIYISIALVIMLSCFLGIESFGKSILGGYYTEVPSTHSYITIPAAQMSYITIIHEDELSDYQKQEAEFFVRKDSIMYKVNTTPERWAFNFNYYGYMQAENVISDLPRFWGYYWSLAESFPKSFIEEYENITSIVWASPNYGYTSYRSKGISDYMGPQIATPNSLLPKLQSFLDETIFAPSETMLFFWRPAIYLLMSFLLLMIATRRHGFVSWIILAPTFFNAAGYMLVNPSQNVRYMYGNISVFLILLVFTLMLPQKEDSFTKINKNCDDD